MGIQQAQYSVGAAVGLFKSGVSCLLLISGGIIPTYLVVVKLGLINTIWSLVLPYAMPVFNMVILMNFMRALPEDIEEAATIDGANAFQMLFEILIPILRPALATAGLFCLVWRWNDWFSGAIYINDPRGYPLQTYLQTLLVNFQQLIQSSGAANYKSITSMMNEQTGRSAQLFLGALPVMLVYPFLQKYFTKGIVLGSVKG